MVRIKKIILALILLSAVVNPAFARRVKTVPIVGKNYYTILRNILTKYIPFSQARSIMDGFSVNLRIFNNNAPQLQEVFKKVAKAILEIEDPRVNILNIPYFIGSILPEFQANLYMYSASEIYGEVLNVIVDDLKRLDKTVSGEPEKVFCEIISKNSSRDDDIGVFFAQMFYDLYVRSSNFEQEYSELQRIISGKNYKSHTKLQILREAAERIVNRPEKITSVSVELNLLVDGSLQNDLFVKAYAISTLSELCLLDGFSAETRMNIFNSALNGIKSIHWDIYFDRNGEVPEEVNYLAVLIDYLVRAEESCREFGLDVDLAQDEQFVKIYRLLLFKGFDLRQGRIFLN